MLIGLAGINIFYLCFSGEKNRSVFKSKDLRCSQEWFENSWKKMEARPDIIKLISSANKTNSETTKSNDNVSDLSSEENRDFEGDLLASLNWNWSTTKKRHRGLICKNNSLGTAETRKHDRFTTGCKFTRGQKASPLTSLVMSR